MQILIKAPKYLSDPFVSSNLLVM